MRSSDLFGMAYKALKDRKLRSALTVLGIVIGSALIVALTASSSGLSASVGQQIEKIGVTTIQVASRSTRNPLDSEDVEDVKQMAGVKDVIPYYSRRLSISSGSSSITVSLFALEQDKLQTLYKGMTLSSGSFVDQYDPTGAVVGSGIAEPQAENASPLRIDDLVALQGSSFGGSTSATATYNFIVRGILEPYGSAGFTNLDESVFVALTAAQMVFSSAYYSGFYVVAETPENVDGLVTQLREFFGTDVQVFSASALLSTVQSITQQLTLFLGSVATVSLFVAAVGITNTMFVSVMERTREIGILKALGYRPRQIMSLFLSEAAITGMLGSIFGTIFGVVLSFFLGGGLPFFRFGGGGGGGGGPFGSASYSPVFSFELILFSIFFPIGLAVLAGLYPAWRASRMNAVAALKYE